MTQNPPLRSLPRAVASVPAPAPLQPAALSPGARDALRAVVWALLAAATSFVVLHVGSRLRGGMSYLDLDAEGNLPTWYASALLLAVCGSAAAIALLHRAGGSAADARWWRGFALVYAYLSADEVARLHETVDDRTPGPWGYWYAPAALLFFLWAMRRLWSSGREPPAVARRITAGLVVFAAGALGCELAGYLADRADLLHAGALREIEVVLEEGLELAGTSLVLVGCLTRLLLLHAARYGPARVPEGTGEAG